MTASELADPVVPKTPPHPPGGHEPTSRAAAINALAVLTVAIGSALQVAVYLRDFGATHRTDGFIAAFAIYSLVVVLGQLLRTTAVPLLSGPRPAMTQTAFGWAVGVLAVVLAVLIAALASPLGHVVARASGPSGRSVAVTSLLVMAPAMGLQIAGSGLAVKGAVQARIEPVALAYIGSAVVGVVAFFALKSATDEAVIAWSMLAASLALVVGQTIGTRARLHRAPPVREIRAAAALVVRTLPLPASFVLMYPVTLALLPDGRPGAITVFGLAYGACSYLISFTGQALSMTDSVTLAGLDDDAHDRRRTLVCRAFRYSVLLAAPGLGVAAVAGGPILGRLLPATSSGSGTLLTDDLLLMSPWLIAMLALWATLPAVLARPRRSRRRWEAMTVAGLLALHIVAILAGRLVDGFDGAIVAMFVAPAVFVALAIRVTVSSAARELIDMGVRAVAIAVISFGLPALANYSLTSAGPVLAVVTAIVGAAIYAATVATSYPHVARTLIALARDR